MKYLKKFNESVTRDLFPSPEIPIKIIEDYLVNYSGMFGLDLEKVPGFGTEWKIDVENTNIARYYSRVFPNDMGYLPDHIKITPRIDFNVTSCVKKVEDFRMLFKELSFLPKALLSEGYYSYMYFNDGNDNNAKDTHSFINVVVYSNKEDYESKKGNSIFSGDNMVSI